MTTPDGVAETIIDSAAMEWIPLGEGEWFKPLGFGPGGWRRLILRLAPGVVVARHRHRGEVHAFNIAGHRQIAGRDDVIGPGGYVYEPAGNVDSWSCVGTEDCIVSIIVAGAMEYLDEDDRVVVRGDRDRTGSTPGHHPAPSPLMRATGRGPQPARQASSGVADDEPHSPKRLSRSSSAVTGNVWGSRPPLRGVGLF